MWKCASWCRNYEIFSENNAHDTLNQPLLYLSLKDHIIANKFLEILHKPSIWLG